jgi:hypothetical protein
LNKLRPSKNPFKNYFNRGESDLKIFSMSRWNQFKLINSTPDPADEKENTLEGRLGGLGASLVNTGLFNNRFTPANTWRPLVTLAKLVPISVNPNSNNPLGTFNTCTSPSGDEGICTPGAVCSLFGGRPGSSCNQGQVCCISKSLK